MCKTHTHDLQVITESGTERRERERRFGERNGLAHARNCKYECFQGLRVGSTNISILNNYASEIRLVEAACNSMQLNDFLFYLVLYCIKNGGCDHPKSYIVSIVREK